MASFSQSEMEDALQAIAAMMERGEKLQGKFAPGTPQHTLQRNRANALCIAAALIQRELNAGEEYHFGKEDLEKARAPIASLIHKSEKAQRKLAPGTWQYTLLGKNLKALYIAAPLLEKAVEE